MSLIPLQSPSNGVPLTSSIAFPSASICTHTTLSRVNPSSLKYSLICLPPISPRLLKPSVVVTGQSLSGIIVIRTVSGSLSQRSSAAEYKKKSKLGGEIKIAILKKAALIQLEDRKKFKKDKKYKKKIGTAKY